MKSLKYRGCYELRPSARTDNYKRWQKLSTIGWQKVAQVTAAVSPLSLLRNRLLGPVKAIFEFT
jgi:hypothetical protein